MLYQTYNVDVEKVDKIIIGSVVPQLTHIISSALYKIHGIEAIVVDRKTTLHSSQVQSNGNRYFANLVAAHFLYPNKKKIILDFEPALTASCVAEDGEVLGVIIAPGIITSLILW